MSNSENIDIDYLANLARLEIKPEEKQQYIDKINSTLLYLKKLNTVNVTAVEATSHAFPIYNVWAEDEPTESLAVDAALRNAPATENNQIIVPKVIE